MADDNGGSQWGLVEPFDIDNGELDGLRSQIVFCLGYEVCQFSGLLDDDGPFRRTVHSENVSRLKRACIRRGRRFKAEPCCGCEAEWTYFDVAGVDGRFVTGDHDLPTPTP